MAKTKTTDNTDTGRPTAVRGFNYAPPASPGEASAEIRVEAGQEIPSTVPDSVIDALVAEGSATR